MLLIILVLLGAIGVIIYFAIPKPAPSPNVTVSMLRPLLQLTPLGNNAAPQ
jgi:hypothetical protein